MTRAFNIEVPKTWGSDDPSRDSVITRLARSAADALPAAEDQAAALRIMNAFYRGWQESCPPNVDNALTQSQVDLFLAHLIGSRPDLSLDEGHVFELLNSGYLDVPARGAADVSQAMAASL